MISDVVVSKPNKALNITFLIFGYVLASYIVSSIELVFEQQVPAVIVAGGVFSSFLYYIKPVDRLIILFLYIRSYESPLVFSSPLLAEERAKINGAVFFSLSLLLASRLLSLINLYVPFQILIALSIVMIAVALWESWVAIRLRMPIVISYLRLQQRGEISEELAKAVENKNWELAHQFLWKMKRRKFDAPLRTIGDNVLLGSFSKGGFCYDCGFITKRERAQYCSKCGKPLITHCKYCYDRGYIRHSLAEKTEEIPKFCDYCGKPFIKKT